MTWISLTFSALPFRIAFGDMMDEKEVQIETEEEIDNEPLLGQISFDELLAEIRLEQEAMSASCFYMPLPGGIRVGSSNSSSSGSSLAMMALRVISTRPMSSGEAPFMEGIS